MTILRLFSALAFTATVIVAAYGCCLLTDRSFEVAYEPFRWMCLNVPWFVETHEQWIELFGMVRGVGIVLLSNRDDQH